jgi:prophage regulatory protein
MANLYPKGTTVAKYQALTLKQLESKIGAGKTFIYSSIKAGTFPRPLRVGRRSSWLESEVDQWMCERIAERDTGTTDAIAQRAKRAAAAKQAAAKAVAA